MTISVSVENLAIEYPDRHGKVQAVRNVSLTINAGETVAIIGRSGSGKTSLLRALGGLVAPSAGTVNVAGHPIENAHKDSRAFYRDVGMVFQDYGLVPQLSALQNVLCGRLFEYPSRSGLIQFRKPDLELAAHHLRSLGLEHRMHTRSSRLSGGEQQRVALARLRLQNPRVMLLDEPLASLDVHWCDQVMRWLQEGSQRETTTIIVLHDLAIARKYADRVLLVHDGELLFDGAVEEGCRRLEQLEMRLHPQGQGVQCPVAWANPVDSERAALDSTTEHGAAPGRLPLEERKLPEGMFGRTSFYVTVICAIVALYAWSAFSVRFNLARVFSNWENAVHFVQRMFPPDFSVTTTVAGSLVETLQMALIGTTLAAMVSLPIAMGAARNLSWRPLQAICRLTLNMLRTVPSIIWGLFFVAIVGLGPVPGILALTFYASGYLGKFYYEAIESIDPRPLVALQTVGTSTLQRFRYGVFPQVLPLFLGYTLYMFEYNLRAASILGIVGAGGIGFYLNSFITNFHYNKAVTALLLLLAVVSIIDFASSRLRASLTQ